jgi:hypothetical protein
MGSALPIELRNHRYKNSGFMTEGLEPSTSPQPKLHHNLSPQTSVTGLEPATSGISRCA